MTALRERWRTFADRLSLLHPRRLSLRTRIMSMFSIGALVLSAFLATAAYTFTRSSLVNICHGGLLSFQCRSAHLRAAR